MAKEETPAGSAAPAAPKTKEPVVGFADVAKEVNNVERAIKVLEDRVYNLREKEKIDAENVLDTNKKVFGEIRVINSDLLDVKRDVEDIKTKLRLIISELKISAKKEEIDLLKKYLDLWEPLNFVTRGEVEKIVGSIIEDKIREKGL
jgi:hypothetical protein